MKASTVPSKEKDYLVHAVISGDEVLLSTVLEETSRLSEYINESIVEDKQTLLMLAARHGWLSMARVLVRKGGADVDAVSPSGLTALMLACWKGHDDMVAYLLDNGADLKKACREGLHALSYASKYGHLPCVERLLKLGGEAVDIDKKHGGCMTAFAYACLEDHPEVARALVLSGGADYTVDPFILEKIRARGNRDCVALTERLDGLLALLKAAVDDGHLERLRALVREGPPVFKRPVEPGGSKNLLMYAIDRGQTDMALLLIEEKGMPLNWRVLGGRTALHDACGRGNETLVKALLKNGADPSVECSDGKTALWFAVAGGHTGTVVMLLTSPSFAPGLWKRDSGRVIRQALERHCADTLRALVELGIGHLEHPGYFWASDAALILDRPGIGTRGAAAQYLQVMDAQTLAFHAACVQGNVEEVDTWLTSHPYLLYKPGGEKRHTALMESALFNRVAIAKVLLRHDKVGSERVAERVAACPFHPAPDPVVGDGPLLPHGIDAVNKDKATALSLASEKGHVGLVALLLEHGGKGFVHDMMARRRVERNSDAMQAACQAGHTPVVRLLLEGCEAFVEPKRLGEALVTAASLDQEPVFRLLLSHVRVGKDQPMHLSYALYVAARLGRVAMLRLLVPLLDHCDVNVALSTMTQALCNAVREGRSEAAKLMLEQGADTYTQDYDGAYISLLEEQEQREADGDEAWACLELLQGAQCERIDLVSAVQKGDIGTLEASLGHLDPQARRLKLRGRSATDFTPLTMAVKEGHAGIVERLLEWGAEVDLAGRDGMTPLKLAVQQGRQDLIRRLCAAGAQIGAAKYEKDDKLVLKGRTYDALAEADDAGALTTLLELGAYAGGGCGEVALRRAIDKDNAPVVQALLPHMGRWLSLPAGSEVLMSAVARGHEEVLREVLVSGAEDSQEWRRLLARAEMRARMLHGRCPLVLKLAQREDLYTLHKARTIHDSSTPGASLSACLANRAEPQQPLPTVTIAGSVPPEGKGQVDKTEVVVAVTQFVVRELKHDLYVELSELLADAEPSTPALIDLTSDAEYDSDDEIYEGSEYDEFSDDEFLDEAYLHEPEVGGPLYDDGDY